jgi:hypothetical protein
MEWKRGGRVDAGCSSVTEMSVIDSAGDPVSPNQKLRRRRRIGRRGERTYLNQSGTNTVNPHIRTGQIPRSGLRHIVHPVDAQFRRVVNAKYRIMTGNIGGRWHNFSFLSHAYWCYANITPLVMDCGREGTTGDRIMQGSMCR